MGLGQITLSEMVRAVVVGKRVFPMAVGLVVVMIWNKHVGTGRVGAEETHRTVWCSILMTRARPGGTATNEGPADAQGRGRPPTIAEIASGAVVETKTTQAGTSRGGAIVTVTSVTELIGVKISSAVRHGILCKPYTDISGCLIVSSSFRHHSITVRPKSDGWEGNQG